MSRPMIAGDFFRCFDGPSRYKFGRCLRHDDEWLVVEFFGNGEPRFGWEPIPRRVAYPYSLSRGNADRFLEVAEVWE